MLDTPIFVGMDVLMQKIAVVVMASCPGAACSSETEKIGAIMQRQ